MIDKKRYSHHGSIGQTPAEKTGIKLPLSKEESENLFRNCVECKTPPTYRTLDPSITEGMFFVGFPIIAFRSNSQIFYLKPRES